MRKLTTIAALVLSLSLTAPAATYASTSISTKSVAVQRDDPRDRDLISRVVRFILKQLHLAPTDSSSPIIPVP